MVGSIEPMVRKFIAESFMYREGISTLKDDDSLLDRGLIDSTGVLELVFFIEKTFSIKINDEEVMPENLDSVKRISELVRRKLEPQTQVQVA
jgi:acyl carrier protein